MSIKATAAGAYLAGMPALLAAALGIAGRVPREPPPAAEFGQFEHRRLLAYSGLLQALDEAAAANDHKAELEAAKAWADAVENGRIQTVSPNQVGIESGDGIVGQLNARIGNLLFTLRRSAQEAAARKDFEAAAEIAGVGASVCAANAESSYATLRRSLQFERDFARIAEAVGPKASAEARRLLAYQLAGALRRRPDAAAVAYHTQARHARLDLAVGRDRIDPVAERLYARMARNCTESDVAGLASLAEQAKRIESGAGQISLEASLARTVIAAIRGREECFGQAIFALSTRNPG